MKNIKIIVLILLTSVLVPACTDYLDVRPENQMLLDDYWKKESDVEATVLACYRAMQENEYMWRVMLWGELRSDNVIADASADDSERQIDNVNILPSNSNCKWGSVYTVINYCNTVLEYAPGVVDYDPNFTVSDLRAKEAEVLAIRALSYFYLVRTFRHIPLVLEATISDDQNLMIPQSSPEDVLDRIVEDLLYAETWALNSFLTTKETKGRMTKDAIRAILADVYLWKKDYSSCITYCDKLINATKTETVFSGTALEVPKYELIESDFESASSSIFNKGNSDESIFELQFSSNIKSNESVFSLYGNSTTMGKLTAATLYAESDLVFPQTDERKADFIETKKSGSGAYKIFKYLGARVSNGSANEYSYRQLTPNWIFYRITDVMLMKAEALVQLDGEDNLRKALQIVNKTYMRSNVSLQETDTLVYDSYSSSNAMEKLVLLERQRELMFEGKRWFDLVRHSERKKSTNDLVDYLMFKYTSNQSAISTKLSVMNALYLPIHVDELKVNPLLKQNPYYESSSNIEK